MPRDQPQILEDSDHVLFVMLHRGKASWADSLLQNAGFSSRILSGRIGRDIALRCPPKALGAARRPYQRPGSFHGHTLGEIARFIDIAAEFDGEMIGKELKRDDGQNR